MGRLGQGQQAPVKESERQGVSRAVLGQYAECECFNKWSLMRGCSARRKMVQKDYQWLDGAKLEEHSKRKHKILREYFSRYLSVRCQLPQQERFRLAVVEGFAGAGRYSCGTSGSPLIFVEE